MRKCSLPHTYLNLVTRVPPGDAEAETAGLDIDKSTSGVVLTTEGVFLLLRGDAFPDDADIISIFAAETGVFSTDPVLEVDLFGVELWRLLVFVRRSLGVGPGVGMKKEGFDSRCWTPGVVSTVRVLWAVRLARDLVVGGEKMNDGVAPSGESGKKWDQRRYIYNYAAD